MTARRIIREVPLKGIEFVPAGAVIVDGHIDYIDDGEVDVPEDAKYVATMDAARVIIVKDTFDPPRMVDVLNVKGQPVTDEHGNVKQEAAPNTSRHSFAGWPNPGEKEE